MALKVNRRKKKGGGRRKTNKQANKQANKSLNKGIQLGGKLAPELFGEGLVKTDFNDYNKFLQPSLNEAGAFKSGVTQDFGELSALRKDRLGGLNSAQNQTHREAMFRDIDRGNAAGLREVARARAGGQGAGASFAQRRALERDRSEAGARANRQVMLDNHAIQGQALGDYENTIGAKQQALAGADATLAGVRGAQLTTKTGVDQFNAGQQQAEIGAKVGAISAGTGLFKDERDRIEAERKQKEMLQFLKERDDAKFSQLQGFL